jgi:hypothetical protein
MLTRNLREHGKMQLMMYGRPSANYQFPSSMWLLPGGLNGWFAARDFQGLNQEHIECSHQMVLVSCDEGQSNRTLYTIYPSNAKLKEMRAADKMIKAELDKERTVIQAARKLVKFARR